MTPSVGIKIVTGFVPLPGHPRTAEEYQALGEKLIDIDNDHAVFVAEVERCWLFQFLAWRGAAPTHAVADNPKKNTVGYHCVQHQKTDWMRVAAMMDNVSEVFVWIDYGIFSIPGITEGVIETFLGRAAKERGIAIPGCWTSHPFISDDDPCWRFCGGVIVCHRSMIHELDAAVKSEAIDYFKQKNRVRFEVNTWARIEQKGVPIFWYPADHNQSMFSGYPETRWSH